MGFGYGRSAFGRSGRSGWCRLTLNQAETALIVTPQRPDPQWSPTILGVFSNSHGEIRITLNWIKINQSNSVQVLLPIYWV